jgi:4-hydroxythreonine-4-phosphate dehydrogenase
MKPTIAVFSGDPAGIGSEVLAKMLADPQTLEQANILIVSSRSIMEEGMRSAEVSINIPDANPIPQRREGLQFIHWDSMDAYDFVKGEVTPKSGRFMLEGLSTCLQLCVEGIADAICIAPLNKAALRAGGMKHPDEMNYFCEVLNYSGPCVEFNVNDKLWTSRVTSHVPHKDVSGLLTPERVARNVELLIKGLTSAGFDKPRVAVCGLNPHNGDGGAFGRDEIEVIEPGIKLAASRGFVADGPFPADTTFVRAMNKTDGGGYDGVLTMYHDQGQIAMKLMSFGHGITVHYGLPMPITTTAHGTAYDIVGKGIAESAAMKNAFKTASRMGAAALIAKA